MDTGQSPLSSSPSPGTPGEGRGEGRSEISNSLHPNPNPEYRARGQIAGATANVAPRISQRQAIWIATIIFAGLSLWAGLVSPGFLEADACTHYQYARWCFAAPSYLVNVWGRPVCTGLYAIPALLAGRTGTKIASLLVALGIAAATYRIAKLQRYHWPVLAFIFVLAGPLVFLESFATLTELPFALLMAVGFLAYREKRWWEFALVCGAMPLSRPEGFGFLILAGIALILHRRFHWLLLLPIPLLVWDIGGWLDYGHAGPWWNWLIQNWPYAAESLYKPGPIYHFLILLPVVTGPFIFPFMCLGIWKNARGWKKFFTADHLLRCDILIAAIPLAILLGHSLLYFLGKMASNGEMRYMLIVMPFWALLAARGWEWTFAQLSSPVGRLFQSPPLVLRGRARVGAVLRSFSWAASRPILLAGVAAILPIFANVIYPVIPVRFDYNWQEARQMAQWYEQTPLRKQYPKLLCAHPGIAYFLDINPSNPDVMVPWKKQSIHTATRGVVLIWDDIYALYNSNADLAISRKQIIHAGWVLYSVAVDGYGHHWAIYLSPKTAAGKPTAIQRGGGMSSTGKLLDTPNTQNRDIPKWIRWHYLAAVRSTALCAVPNAVLRAAANYVSSAGARSINTVQLGFGLPIPNRSMGVPPMAFSHAQQAFLSDFNFLISQSRFCPI